ncbi:hypothetical protein EVJ58_g6412 [Rhodofomes roseus]|uniref:Uncharacterized protein n=1 Tax=Rhodofomes roseus TaxID=34475 RepID=A0A4Y9Y7X0_9APHY|nr:hypothetical protein EVJ58_g6412 [Rhodofomes roseus]
MQFNILGLLVALIAPFFTMGMADPAPAIGSYYLMATDVDAAHPTAPTRNGGPACHDNSCHQ